MGWCPSTSAELRGGSSLLVQCPPGALGRGPFAKSTLGPGMTFDNA